MVEYILMGVTHSRQGERLYHPPDEQGLGFPVSYRVFPGVPLTRERAVADCPTIEAARAARRLLSEST